MRIAIIGCGPSALDYVPLADAYGDRSKRFDEVWAINSMGSVIACDRIFHMDDLRVQELRAEADPEGKIGPMLAFFKRTSIPIMTSREYADYPAAKAFPLDKIVSHVGTFHFTSTPAYAIAYALYKGAEEIALFGMDYTWPNSHLAEEGRACIEFWLGFAMARGVLLQIGASSTLMATRDPIERRLYGYDSQRLVRIEKEGEAVQFIWEDKELPTAAEMEERYDKTKPLSGVAA